MEEPVPLCIPVRVAHAEAGLWLWAELDTGATTALMTFETLQALFPDRKLVFSRLPEGLPDEQRHSIPGGTARGHGSSWAVKYVVLYYRFGKRQPLLKIPTKVSLGGDHTRVIIGYSAMKTLGLVLEPAKHAIVAGNGEDLAEAALPVVPAGPVSRAEVATTIEQCKPQDWRVWMPLEIIGEGVVLTWPVLLDTGASDVSIMTWNLLKSAFPSRKWVLHWNFGTSSHLDFMLPRRNWARGVRLESVNAAGQPIGAKTLRLDTRLGDILDEERPTLCYSPDVPSQEQYIMGLDQMRYFGMRIDLAANLITLKDGSTVKLVEMGGQLPAGPIATRPLADVDMRQTTKRVATEEDETEGVTVKRQRVPKEEN